eukprot:scaffold246_cov242-Pinguiococcus_pyrenoidosus.AAC.17
MVTRARSMMWYTLVKMSRVSAKWSLSDRDDLHRPEHVNEDAPAAALQLLDLDACSVRRLGLVLGVKRRRDLRQRQKRDIQEHEECDDDKDVLELHANLLELSTLEDPPDAIQLRDQRCHRHREAQVEDPWSHGASGLALAANREEAADIEHHAAEHTGASQLWLRQADDVMLSEHDQPTDERYAHACPEARKGDGSSTMQRVYRHEGALCRGFRVVHVAAECPILDREHDLEVSIGLAAGRGDVVVGRSCSSSGISDGSQLRVRIAEDVIHRYIVKSKTRAGFRCNVLERSPRHPVIDEVQGDGSGHANEEEAAELAQNVLLQCGIVSVGDHGVRSHRVEGHRIIKPRRYLEGLRVVLRSDADRVRQVLRVLHHWRSRHDVSGRRISVRGEALRRVVGHHLPVEGCPVWRKEAKRRYVDRVVERLSSLVVGFWPPAGGPSVSCDDVTVAISVEEDVRVPLDHVQALRSEEKGSHVGASPNEEREANSRGL